MLNFGAALLLEMARVGLAGGKRRRSPTVVIQGDFRTGKMGRRRWSS
jgi:hypothetical protein